MYTLITSAASAAAYRLKNKLNLPGIILGDYNEVPDVMIKSGKIISLPNPASGSYVHDMLTLCLDKGIDTVYPLNENEAKYLTEAKQLFKEYNIEIVLIVNELQ